MFIDFAIFLYVTVKAGGMRIVQHKNTTGDKIKCNVPAADVANAALKISTR